MRELEVFEVFIHTENRDSWRRKFIGRPSRDDVLMALDNDARDHMEAAASAAASAAGPDAIVPIDRVLPVEFRNLITIVKSDELPMTNSVITYAGVKVGQINITHKPPVLLMGEL
jgi:hypothetical protein